MVKFYVTEKEMKQFGERTHATAELAGRHGVKVVSVSNVEYNLFEVILAFYSVRLDNSSKKLNCLTWTLIGLTLVLAVLTGFLVLRTLGVL